MIPERPDKRGLEDALFVGKGEKLRTRSSMACGLPSLLGAWNPATWRVGQKYPIERGSVFAIRVG